MLNWLLIGMEIGSNDKREYAGNDLEIINHLNNTKEKLQMFLKVSLSFIIVTNYTENPTRNNKLLIKLLKSKKKKSVLENESEIHMMDVLTITAIKIVAVFVFTLFHNLFFI